VKLQRWRTSSAKGMKMCDCHPDTPELREALKVTEVEPNTKEDWRDLHDLIETYRRRRAARHVLARLIGSDSRSVSLKDDADSR
jgi:hypothetical protein